MIPAVNSKHSCRLAFASIVFPDKSSEVDALLLADSIRTYAGGLSQNPIWYFTPKFEKQLSAATIDRLFALNVKLASFEIDNGSPRFPFKTEAFAAALAESIIEGQTDLVAWLGTNTIVLQEPTDFLLQHDKNLGYRPVHHTLIGSTYSEPIDPFWTLIYRYCSVPKDRIFPMKTHVEAAKIRPYFNAGLLVVRPQKHLLQAWRDTFFKIYHEPPFQEFYQQDERYKIFIHQAVLSAVILSNFATSEIQELPPTYNYPLHLLTQDATENRPSYLEELVTFRHERFYDDPEWINKMPARRTLKQWIAKQLGQ